MGTEDNHGVNVIVTITILAGMKLLAQL